MKRYAVIIVAVIAAIFLSAASKCKEEKHQKPIVPKEKIALWNGKDFAGWKMFGADKQADANTAWSAKNGVIRCQGEPKGYIQTKVDYANYNLHIEWRWPEE